MSGQRIILYVKALLHKAHCLHFRENETSPQYTIDKSLILELDDTADVLKGKNYNFHNKTK